jgi:alpha-ketoglutarate-dependent taurine dioxygenase
MDLPSWARANRALIEERLLSCGALLFRGFVVDGPEGFERFIEAASRSGPLDYTYRSSMRKNVLPRIYTSTEYPPNYSIPLHHENAYASDWPMKIFFFCVTPAQEEGETPLADGRAVLASISPQTRAKFSAGVRYRRCYGKLDLPWQEVFQTESRDNVESYCHEHGIEFEWRGDRELRTCQVSQGIARHPTTNEDVWFNQAHLFHVSALPKTARETMLENFSEDDLPRNATYADGRSIETSVLDEVRAAYEKHRKTFPWREGDVLLLDNMLFAHGRSRYKGARRVLVGMADPFSAVSS